MLMAGWLGQYLCLLRDHEFVWTFKVKYNMRHARWTTALFCMEAIVFSLLSLIRTMFARPQHLFVCP